MARGMNSHGDVLVNRTADGVGLDELWSEIQKVLELWNNQRKDITDLLSFRTTDVASAIPQSWTSESLEEATEFGLPTSVASVPNFIRVGYNFKDYDRALRSSWKYLRDATAEQVRNGVTLLLEADNKKTTGTIMRRIFNPTVYVNDWGTNCYGLWNSDNMIPPPHMGHSFDGTHSHYLATASTYLESAHVEALMNHVAEHGYSSRVGSTLLVLLNDVDFETSRISSWRANEEYRPGSALPKWDFIPSALMPAWISEETIHGSVPDAQYNNLDVWGSYGGALIIKSAYIPRNYVAVVATGGPNSEVNPVGFREHVKEEYRGFLHQPGPGRYPIIDSSFIRSFGVGVRHRGAAVVAQITASSSYTPPADGAIPV